MREFGSDGWGAFLPALLLADRVDTWLPSGDHLREAHEKRRFPFSEEEVIELFKLGVFRIGGRLGNFVGDDRKFYTLGDSKLDRYISRRFDSLVSDGSLVIHEHDSHAKIALDEFLKAEDSQHYNKARFLLSQHKSGNSLIPDIVLDRHRRFFLQMDKNDISDDSIRRFYTNINENIGDFDRREESSIIYQMIRLSFEHRNVKDNFNCEIHLGHGTHANSFQFVSSIDGSILHSGQEGNEGLDVLVELIQFLSERNKINSIDSLLDRKEMMKPFRESIWRCFSRADSDVLEEIGWQVRAYSDLRRPFFDQSSGRGIDATISSGVLVASLAVLIGQMVASGFSNALPVFTIPWGGFRLGRSYYERQKSEAVHPGKWPVLIVAERPNAPTASDIETAIGDIEYFTKQTNNRDPLSRPSKV